MGIKNMIVKGFSLLKPIPLKDKIINYASLEVAVKGIFAEIKKKEPKITRTDSPENDSHKVLSAKGALNLLNKLTTLISTSIEECKKVLRVDIAKKQNKNDSALATENKTIIGGINENVNKLESLSRGKQDKQDDTLFTNSKNVVGAINELENKKANLSGATFTGNVSMVTGSGVKGDSAYIGFYNSEGTRVGYIGKGSPGSNNDIYINKDGGAQVVLGTDRVSTNSELSIWGTGNKIVLRDSSKLPYGYLRGEGTDGSLVLEHQTGNKLSMYATETRFSKPIIMEGKPINGTVIFDGKGETVSISNAVAKGFSKYAIYCKWFVSNYFDTEIIIFYDRKIKISGNIYREWNTSRTIDLSIDNNIININYFGQDQRTGIYKIVAYA